MVSKILFNLVISKLMLLFITDPLKILKIIKVTLSLINLTLAIMAKIV